jgi:hypothetical protein
MHNDLWLDQFERRCDEIATYVRRSYHSLSGSRSIGDFLVRSGGRLRSAYRFFSGKNVVILGPAGSGKTTLINLLRTGAPAVHNPTAGVALVDRRFELNDATWLKVRSDVGGDALYRPLWGQLVAEIDPDVIIFLLDGRKSVDAVVADTQICLNDALGQVPGRRRLKLIYVFVNFWDVWNLDPVKNDVLRSRVQLTVDEAKSAFGLSGIPVEAKATHMNPNASQWPELENALQHLGSELGHL